MATVKFPWNPLLVDLRREICPAARWEKKGRRWVMTDGDAAAFLNAAHARLDFAKSKAEIRVNDAAWIVGFVAGAPYSISSVAVALAS
jgi:hypothetical protein